MKSALNVVSFCQKLRNGFISSKKLFIFFCGRPERIKILVKAQKIGMIPHLNSFGSKFLVYLLIFEMRRF
jgi:hypothetical protein